MTKFQFAFVVTISLFLVYNSVKQTEMIHSLPTQLQQATDTSGFGTQNMAKVRLVGTPSQDPETLKYDLHIIAKSEVETFDKLSNIASSLSAIENNTSNAASINTNLGLLGAKMDTYNTVINGKLDKDESAHKFIYSKVSDNSTDLRTIRVGLAEIMQDASDAKLNTDTIVRAMHR